MEPAAGPGFMMQGGSDGVVGFSLRMRQLSTAKSFRAAQSLLAQVPIWPIIKIPTSPLEQIKFGTRTLPIFFSSISPPSYSAGPVRAYGPYAFW